MLTLPLCGLLRSAWPQARILYLGRSYTLPVAQACSHIDVVLNWDDMAHLPRESQEYLLECTGATHIVHVFPRPQLASLARAAGIPVRIGATGRLYHWYTCTRLVPMTRKRSHLHEAQLNVRLAASLLPASLVSAALEHRDYLARWYGLSAAAPLPEPVATWLAERQGQPLVVLHPRSAGSAREWPTSYWAELARQLHQLGIQAVVTGTEKEAQKLGLLENAIALGEARSLMGQLTLAQLMTLLAAADAVVAASTGPLHLAAALGTPVVGLYPTQRPMHPGRWAPIGQGSTEVLVDGRNGADDLRGIRVQQVFAAVQRLLHKGR